MKKQLCLVALSLVFLITSLIPSSFFVYAEDIEQNALGIADFYLYNELLNLANIGRPEPLLKLETDALSTVDTISIVDSQIASLEGLQLLNLSNVKTLNLSGNQISNITSQQLSTLTSLEQLNLSSNNLTQIDVAGLVNLNTLILNNNNLTQIDLSQISYNAILGNGYVNLKNNEFKNLEDIILPSELTNSITIDLNNNYLINQNISAYTSTHLLNLAFQGVKEQGILTEGDLLSLYDNGIYYADFNIKIYNALESNLLEEVYGINNIELTSNTYLLKYFDGQVELYDEQDSATDEFKPILFTVRPQKPTITVLQEEQEIEAQAEYTKAVTLEFDNCNANATIYYSINSGAWVEGNSLELTNNGRYTLYIKANYNGIESNLLTVTFDINDPFQATLNVFKAFASLTLLILILAGGYYYKTKKTNIE